MSTTSGSRDYGRFDELAEEFVERYRRGERPGLQEYVDRLPEMAAEIREMFPALVEVEQADGDALVEARQPSPPAIKRLREIGDYRILREVGRGGMGVVYEAEQISLGRRVALKVLPAHAVGDRTAMERFRREAKAAARMHHTNIVPVFEVGREGEFAFYAMQLIQGQGLDQVIDELKRLHGPDRVPAEPGSAEPDPLARTVEAQGAALTGRDRDRGRIAELLLSGRMVTEGPGAAPTAAPTLVGFDRTEAIDPDAPWDRATGDADDRRPPAPPAADPSSSAVLPGGTHVSEFDTSGQRQPFFQSVAQIGRQAAQGLSHAHSRGIVHRDIKPSNLLLDTAGVVWITDFGLAKSDDDGLTATGDILGTLRYMAPERFRGQGDARADLYSLGMTLYELLTLRPAYDSLDRLQLIEQIQGQEPPRPRSIDARIPRDLETIVLKAMDRDPEARYPTADAMAEDLRRFLADEPIQARQVSTSERSWRWARRNPAIATLGGVLTALLIAMTVGSLLVAGRFASLAKTEGLARDRAERASGLARAAESETRRFANQAEADKGLAQRETHRAEIETRRAELETQRAEGEARRAEQQLKRAEQLVYSSKLMLAQNDFEAGNGGLARHYLDQAQVSLRGWEHRHLWTRVNARQTLVVDKGSTVYGVAFSPDGSRIATASSLGTRVWDAATGQAVLALRGYPGLALSVAFSPDGSRIVTGGGKWSLEPRPDVAKVWDAATGRELLTLSGHTGCLWSVAFSPDGSRIVTGAGPWAYGPGESKVWDAATGRELLTLPGNGQKIRSVAFSPDGRRIVTGATNGEARLWDATTGRELAAFPKRPLESLAFSPDGGRIVTAHVDGSLTLWDSTTGQNVFAIKAHGMYIDRVAFSPDGRRILTGSADQTARVWDAATGQELFKLRGHADRIASVAFSPDGGRIVTGSYDGTAKVWSAATGQEIPVLRGHIDGVVSLAFDAEGRRIVTASLDGTARVWDVATARPLLVLQRSEVQSPEERRLTDASFSADGSRIVTGGEDGTARIWDARTGEQLLRLKLPGRVGSVAFSPDGRRIVTGTWFGTGAGRGEAKVWDAETGRELLTFQRNDAGIHSVKFSPDGSRILTGSQDSRTRVWDAATGRELLVLEGHAGPITSVAFRQDGRSIVTGSADRTARVWDATTGRVLLSLTGHTAEVASVVFSPDGSRIVTGSADRSAKVWDAESGQELLAFRGHDQRVESVAFSPDGSRIVTGIAGGNATASIWSAGRGQEVLVLQGQRELLVNVAFSPDGKRIFGWDAQKRILAWSATDGRSLDPSDPPAMPPSGPANSPDGYVQARPEGQTIVVTDQRPSPAENAWPPPDATEREHVREVERDGL